MTNRSQTCFCFLRPLLLLPRLSLPPSTLPFNLPPSFSFFDSATEPNISLVQLIQHLRGMSFLSGPLMCIIEKSVPTGAGKSADLLLKEKKRFKSGVRIQGQFIIRARVQQATECSGRLLGKRFNNMSFDSLTVLMWEARKCQGHRINKPPRSPNPVQAVSENKPLCPPSECEHMCCEKKACKKI